MFYFRGGQKEAYYVNKNEKLRQKVKDLKAYGRDAHSKCKELCLALQRIEEENKRLKLSIRDRAAVRLVIFLCVHLYNV